MPKPTAAVAALLLVILAPSAGAVCTLHVHRADPLTLAWDPIAGVKTYQGQESFDGYITSRNHFITAPSFHIAHRASADAKISYIVTALFDNRTLSVTPSLDGR